MATPRQRTHFLIALIAPFIDGFKRALMGGGGGGAVTGSTAAVGTPATSVALSGTGFGTVGQVTTTTEVFAAAANQYAGCWFLADAQPPALILSHPAPGGGPLVLTLAGAAPATDVGGWRILSGVSHAHGAGTLTAPAGGSSAVHHDADERTVSVANATDLASSLALTKALLTVYAQHRTDTLHHQAADATNTVASGVADVVDLSSAITAANQLKAAFNAHRAQAGVHWTDDAGHAVTSPDATGQPSLNTLLNEMKGDVNGHFAAGVTDPASWRIV